MQGALRAKPNRLLPHDNHGGVAGGEIKVPKGGGERYKVADIDIPQSRSSAGLSETFGYDVFNRLTTRNGPTIVAAFSAATSHPRTQRENADINIRNLTLFALACIGDRHWR